MYNPKIISQNKDHIGEDVHRTTFRSQRGTSRGKREQSQ
ncbi:hypothetical protein GGR28_003193 [Lewinella aquimaris]|uniref:Uncharacterized protein n=1 Tax=Neolewinella aquimaris TaxID=1835722 RepID=A0A840EF45_9BACT|nr:hypothetical protein [Neolewinella aquimaris]